MDIGERALFLLNKRYHSMKKVIALLSLLFLSILYVSAEDSAHQESVLSGFRYNGYKGNVSCSNHNIVWQGVETSHGYMFDCHHYLGVGVGVFFLPLDKMPVFGRVFAEYGAYILQKGSTPVIGMTVGFCRAVNYNNDCKFRNAAEIEPAVGWSWTLKSGKGLLLEFAYPFYATSRPNTSVTIYGMPKISFGFEF